jgi:hypothetical protein
MWFKFQLIIAWIEFSHLFRAYHGNRSELFWWCSRFVTFKLHFLFTPNHRSAAVCEDGKMIKVFQCVIMKGTVHRINCNILYSLDEDGSLWDVMLCRWVCNSWCFSNHSAFKTLGTAYPKTHCHIPEHLKPQQYHYHNLKSSIVKMIHYQVEPPKESLYRGNNLCKYTEFLRRHTQCW